MIPQLVEIDVYDVTGAARTTVRAADGPSAETFGVGGFSWSPAILTRAVMTLEILATNLDSGIQKGKASLKLARRAMRGMPMSRLYKWKGSPVRILHAEKLDYMAATVEFAGYISDTGYDPDSGELTLTLEVNSDFIDKPLLWRGMSGLGGANGVAEKIGTLFPAGFGVCENIPPVWADESKWIGVIDGYGNTLAITAVMEGASDMGPRVDDYPNYAALAVAIDTKAIPPGRWGSCVAEGLIGLGAPPVKPIGVNATFGSGKPGSLISRAAITHARAPADVIDAASMAALDAAVPYPIHYWTAGQRNVDDLIQAVARAANATAVVTFQGKLQVIRNVSTAPVATLDRSGGQIPRVIGWQTTSPIAPYWQIKFQAERPAAVLALGDVLFVDNLIDRGAYRDEEVYRIGNIVTLPSGSQWLYINYTPTMGNDPPEGTTGNTFWRNMREAISVEWESVGDAAGTKPQDNATNTALPTAPLGPTSTVGQELERLRISAKNALAAVLKGPVLQAYIDAQTKFADGKDIKTVIDEVKYEISDGTSGVAQTLALLGVGNADGTVFIIDANTAEIAPGKKLAQSIKTLEESSDGFDKSITRFDEILVDKTGTTLRSINVLDINGHQVGTYNTLTGDFESEYVIVSDVLKVISPNGGVPITVFQSKPDGTITMHNIEVASIRTKSIFIDGVAPGFSSALRFTAPDAPIGPGETTIIETDYFPVGQGNELGNVMATINFEHDGSLVKDTAATIRIYVDIGLGYQFQGPARRSGIRTNNGDTDYIISFNASVPIASTLSARIKVTCQGLSLGNGPTSGSVARAITIDTLKVGR